MMCAQLCSLDGAKRNPGSGYNPTPRISLHFIRALLHQKSQAGCNKRSALHRMKRMRRNARW